MIYNDKKISNLISKLDCWGADGDNDGGAGGAGPSGRSGSSVARNMMEGYGVDIGKLHGSIGSMTYGERPTSKLERMQASLKQNYENTLKEIEAAKSQPVSTVDRGFLFDSEPTWKDYLKTPFQAMDSRPYEDRLSAYTDTLESIRSPEAMGIYASAVPAAQDLYDNASYQQDLDIQNAITKGISTVLGTGLMESPPYAGMLTGAASLKKAFNRDGYYNDVAEKLGYDQSTIDKALALDLALRSDAVKNYTPNFASTKDPVQPIMAEEVNTQLADSSDTPPIENIKTYNDPYSWAFDYINEKGLLG